MFFNQLKIKESTTEIARNQFTILKQICELIPGHLVPKLAREHGYCGLPRRFKRAINAVDSTTITLVANCIDWAISQFAVSGGSNFHGVNMKNIDLGTGDGNLNIPFSVYETLKEFYDNSKMRKQV